VAAIDATFADSAFIKESTEQASVTTSNALLVALRAALAAFAAQVFRWNWGFEKGAFGPFFRVSPDQSTLAPVIFTTLA